MTARNLIDLAPPVENAFLVAVDTGTEDGWTAQDSLAELAHAAGVELTAESAPPGQAVRA